MKAFKWNGRTNKIILQTILVFLHLKKKRVENAMHCTRMFL